MSADAEQLIRYFVSSPWIVILLSLTCLLVGLVIRSSIRKRRARSRAVRHRRYWRDKFESELPQILNRNRHLQTLPAPSPVPLLNFDSTSKNVAFVLSGEVIGAQALDELNGDGAFDYTKEYDLDDPAPDYQLDPDNDLPVDWMTARLTPVA